MTECIRSGQWSTQKFIIDFVEISWAVMEAGSGFNPKSSGGLTPVN